MSQIEEIAKYDDDSKVWRTSCKCMGDDQMTFMVDTDEEFPEVYLEVWMDVSSTDSVYHLPVWSRPFRSFWWRITNVCSLLFKGSVKVEGSFIFRGEEHIDEFCETILTHKKYMIKKLKEIENE